MPRTTDLPKGEILTRYDQGVTIQTLADEYGREYSTMRENLHRWGAHIRRTGPTRSFFLKEDYFEKIDTERKAYWLGFLLADGYVGRTGAQNWNMKLDLARKDKGHIEKLRAELGTAPVRDRRTSSILTVCSVKLCRDLASHGCVPGKTQGHPVPEVSDRLRRHLYRGYWDGDGWITDSNGQMSYGLMGCPNFVEAHRQWLDAELGVGLGWLQKLNKVNAVRYTGNGKVGRILNLLYAGATVWLDRKRERYLGLRRSGVR